MFLTLCYHSIDRTITDEIAIAEEAFQAQLVYLHEQNYHALSLEQAIDDAVGRQAAPPRSVLLTFDDSYIDSAHTALPLLQRYGMKATLFVITGYIGQNNRWNTRAGYDKEHMSWDDLRAWLDSGCDIGGHSHRHLCMTRLGKEELEETVLVNKRLLQERLQVVPRAFAYPYGQYNQAVQEVVSQHYEIAFAVEKGCWDARSDRFAINRAMVLPSWSAREFGEQVNRRFALNKPTPILSALEEPY